MMGLLESLDSKGHPKSTVIPYAVYTPHDFDTPYAVYTPYDDYDYTLYDLCVP
jgi:hypothetical protein